jgi:hypothetical protein
MPEIRQQKITFGEMRDVLASRHAPQAGQFRHGRTLNAHTFLGPQTVSIDW